MSERNNSSSPNYSYDGVSSLMSYPLGFQARTCKYPYNAALIPHMSSTFTFFFGGIWRIVFGGPKYFHRHNPLWSLSHLPRFAPLGSEAATPPAVFLNAVSLGGNHRPMEEHGENDGEITMFKPFLEPFLEETEKVPVKFDPYLLNF